MRDWSYESYPTPGTIVTVQILREVHDHPYPLQNQTLVWPWHMSSRPETSEIGPRQHVEHVQISQPEMNLPTFTVPPTEALRVKRKMTPNCMSFL